MEGWEDLKQRLGPCRRVFAFMHQAMPDEPLVVLHTALVQGPPPSTMAQILSGGCQPYTVRWALAIAPLFSHAPRCKGKLYGCLRSTKYATLEIAVWEAIWEGWPVEAVQAPWAISLSLQGTGPHHPLPPAVRVQV